jgi:GT2 family glycosyltransferase
MSPEQPDRMPQPRVERPSVGAVVVNFNGGERIVRVLDALCCQQYPVADIVVVDNDSDDGSLAQIRAAFPKVRIIELGLNAGLPTARNVGLRALDTVLAFIVDHDIYADERCIGIMVRAYGGRR